MTATYDLAWAMKLSTERLLDDADTVPAARQELKRRARRDAAIDRGDPEALLAQWQREHLQVRDILRYG